MICANHNRASERKPYADKEIQANKERIRLEGFMSSAPVRLLMRSFYKIAPQSQALFLDCTKIILRPGEAQMGHYLNK